MSHVHQAVTCLEDKSEDFETQFHRHFLQKRTSGCWRCLWALCRALALGRQLEPFVTHDRSCGRALEGLVDSLQMYTEDIEDAVCEAREPEDAPGATLLGWSLAANELERRFMKGEIADTGIVDAVKDWKMQCLESGCEVVDWVHEDLPEGVRLVDLTVDEHGAQVVEWATEMIGTSMRCTSEQRFRESFEMAASIRVSESRRSEAEW